MSCSMFHFLGLAWNMVEISTYVPPDKLFKISRWPFSDVTVIKIALCKWGCTTLTFVSFHLEWNNVDSVSFSCSLVLCFVSLSPFSLVSTSVIFLVAAVFSSFAVSSSGWGYHYWCYTQSLVSYFRVLIFPCHSVVADQVLCIPFI